MKKLLIAAVAATLIFTACEKVKKTTTSETTTTTDNKTLVSDIKGAALTLENTISADRQYMFNTYGKDYAWFESSIILNNYLDEECDGSIASITNVFEYVVDKNVSIDPIVVLSTYTKDGKHTIETGEGMWVGDVVLKDEDIKLTYMEAFWKMQGSNLPKPHSLHCVLRNPLGPKMCNPQYIFGNTRTQIFVDAVTGECKATNPAFEGFEDKLKAPLGEWP